MKFPNKLKPHLVCSKDATRYLITCALAKDGVLYATDGRAALFSLYEKEDQFAADEVSESLLSVDAMKIATKVRSKGFSYIGGVITLLKGGFNKVRDKGLDIEIVTRVPDEASKYPNINKVIPEVSKNVFQIGLNAKMLLNLATALGDDQVYLTFDLDNNGSEFMVENKMPDRFGLLMPCRIVDRSENIALKKVQEIKTTTTVTP